MKNNFNQFRFSALYTTCPHCLNKFNYSLTARTIKCPYCSFIFQRLELRNKN